MRREFCPCRNPRLLAPVHGRVRSGIIRQPRPGTWACPVWDGATRTAAPTGHPRRRSDPSEACNDGMAVSRACADAGQRARGWQAAKRQEVGGGEWSGTHPGIHHRAAD